MRHEGWRQTTDGGDCECDSYETSCPGRSGEYWHAWTCMTARAKGIERLFLETKTGISELARRWRENQVYREIAVLHQEQ